jgi:hypothetical protein
MGVVYRAWHTRLKRAVAVKVLPAERLDNPGCVARFHREMEAVGKLDHPNLVRATDAGEDKGVHFLVMELVEGTDAGKLVRGGALAVADACEVVRQAALGLQHAHEHGLVHRDIKPSNLMVTPAGQVKVLDMGLALLRGGADAGGELTASGHWMGTLDYMAPEQCQDAHRVDTRADVYSLGCTLYRLLTGEPPFGGPPYDTPYRKMEAHAHQPPPPLLGRLPGAPAGLAGVLARMLAKDPAGRFAVPAEAAAALAPFAAGSDLARRVRTHPAGDGAGAASVVEGETGSAGRMTVPLFPPPAPPRRRRLAAAALAVLAGGLGLAALLAFRRPDPPPAHEPPPRAQEPPRPRAWHNLLDRPPEELLWPRGALAPVYDPRQERLLLNCDGMGLVGLGTAAAPGYKLQLGLAQTRWAGGIGVFFGYRQEGEGPDAVRRYQRLGLIPLPRQGPPHAPQRFALCRARGSLRKTVLGWTPQDHGIVMHPLPVLPPLEQTLAIEVSPHGALLRVTWEGLPLDHLTADWVNKKFRRGDYAGAFGVFTAEGTGVFTNARVMFLPKE